MINYPSLDFGKIKTKYPTSGIYLNGRVVNMPTYSFCRDDSGINVKFFVPSLSASGGIDYIIDGGEIVSSECKFTNGFYGAIVDDELINIEDWVLEFGVDA